MNGILTKSLAVSSQSGNQCLDFFAGGVDAQVVPLFRSPGDACRQLMLFRPVFVNLPHPALHLCRCKILMLCGPLLTPFELGGTVGIDENAERMQMSQNRVRTASNDDTFALPSQLFNDFCWVTATMMDCSITL